jgi:RNA polymerase sigma factor (sigma-70 family)
MSSQPGFVLLRHQRKLSARWAARLGRSEAEDLASEAVTRGLARPSPDGRTEPWIESIFRNLVADAGRRQVRRGGPTAEGPGGPIDSLPNLASGANPEEALLAQERARALGAALPMIPAELREAVVARFYEERDYDQMAAAAGITATTARTRVWRGLVRLRRSLEGLGAAFPLALRWGWGSGGSVVSLANALVPAAVVSLLAIVPATHHDGANAILAGGSSMRSPGKPPRTAPARTTLDGSTPQAESSSGSPGSRAQTASFPQHPLRARATPALARGRGTTVPAPGDDADTSDQQPVAVKRYDFDADEVDGELQTPGLVVVTGNAAQARLGSLIEIPSSLEPSMTKMLEDL